MRKFSPTLFALVLLLLLVSSSCSFFSSKVNCSSKNDLIDEEKYLPMLRCIACEEMVKRFIGKMTSTPLGANVQPGRKLQTLSEKEKKRLRKSTASAWAHEFASSDVLCDEGVVKQHRSRMYCQEAVESCEDHLIKLAVRNQLASTLDRFQSDQKLVNETSEKICQKTKYCTIRQDIASQMKQAQDKMKEEFRSRFSYLDALKKEFLGPNLKLYIMLFFGTIFLVTTIMFVFFRGFFDVNNNNTSGGTRLGSRKEQRKQIEEDETESSSDEEKEGKLKKA